jgi:hypothetical protein
VAGCCECGNESSSSVKCEELISWLAEPVSVSRRTLLHGDRERNRGWPD